MESSYQLRDIIVRQTLPDGTVLTAGQYGPDVSNQYPLGYYIEDFEYVDGLGDLDIHNGRTCVTPEYPEGIYCYFVTIDENFDEVYPYIIGPTYYGTVQNGNTGPNGGNNIVPGDAATYNPIGVSETKNSSLQLTYSSNGWNLSGSENFQWNVFNTTGQIINEGKSSFISSEKLSAGMYTILVSTDDEMKTWKVVK